MELYKRSIEKKRGIISILKKETLMWLLLVPTVFSIVICQWNPVIKGFYMSFFHTSGYDIAGFAGLENYKNVLTDTMFLSTLKNMVEYVVWSLVIGFLPPLVIAIMLNELVHGKQLFKVLLYVPVIAPSLAVSIIWMNMYSPASGGLLNSFLIKLGFPIQNWLLNPTMTIPLIIISCTWNNFASTMILYLAALQTMSQDLYEAAVLDGAGIWRRITKITLPHLAPTMLLLFVRQVIGIFQIMEQPLVMTDGGPNNASLTLNLTAYKMSFQYMQVDRALALGVVSFLFLIVATLFYFKIEKKLGE